MKLPSFFILFLTLSLFSCKSSDNAQRIKDSAGDLLIAFYNVENLFDTQDQADKIDEDFTPSGRYKWDETKYQTKLQNLSRVIQSMGSTGPAILGLAEVENRAVLEDLVQMSSLSARNYAIVHEESPDMRGIDVALLYDPAEFHYKSHQAYEILFPTEPDYTSRKVLMIQGKINKEEVYLFVNHWPSRRGGMEVSEVRRLTVARRVRQILEQIRKDQPNAHLLLMGDFNDDPFNKSLAEVLQAKSSPDRLSPDALYNPLYSLHQPDSVGTLTYKGKWNLFDQILISPSLLEAGSRCTYISQSAGIHRPEFMQVGGNGYAKDMPRRAIFRGEFRDDGFSDHFPVYLKLKR
ncbi:MAG: hypothetical protein AAF587_08045 [Bacteroidota bacterium]